METTPQQSRDLSKSLFQLFEISLTKETTYRVVIWDFAFHCIQISNFTLSHERAREGKNPSGKVIISSLVDGIVAFLSGISFDFFNFSDSQNQ